MTNTCLAGQVGTLPNGNNVSFPASNVGSCITTGCNSLSRASLRSTSMDSNNQVYNRPPSSFDVFQGGPSDGLRKPERPHISVTC